MKYYTSVKIKELMVRKSIWIHFMNVVLRGNSKRVAEEYVEFKKCKSDSTLVRDVYTCKKCIER